VASGRAHDFVLLADAFPTGYHATELARRFDRRQDGYLKVILDPSS
jgi:hypothetical protein